MPRALSQMEIRRVGMQDNVRRMKRPVAKLKIDVLGAEISTFYHSRGSRTPILLIHGNSSCKEIFSHQIRFLAERGHRVIAPDLPGHGESADARAPRTTYSFPGYARVLRRLMDQLEVSEFHILGWSLGGHIGL